MGERRLVPFFGRLRWGSTRGVNDCRASLPLCAPRMARRRFGPCPAAGTEGRALGPAIEIGGVKTGGAVAVVGTLAGSPAGVLTFASCSSARFAAGRTRGGSDGRVALSLAGVREGPAPPFPTVVKGPRGGLDFGAIAVGVR